MTTPPATSWFPDAVDLASAALGGEALRCSDDFFAPMSRLVAPEPPVFDPDAYTDRGKLMDGWESRRKRVPGHDWCVIRLGVPGRVVGVVFDTSFFLGNHAPFASLDGAVVRGDDLHAADWRPLVASTPLIRGGHTVLAVADAGACTHVRLHMYPDGGIARLRVFGHPQLDGEGVFDLASAAWGARTVACSDAFFSPMGNLLLPSRSAFMGGGWETRRSRPPGRDWIVVQLARAGRIGEIVLDTGHFKGNYPDLAAVDGLCWPDAPAHALVDHPDWTPIAGATFLGADAEHVLTVQNPGPWTHVRLRIEPDGGVARLRARGVAADPVPDDMVRRVNDASDETLRAVLLRCCHAPRWVDAVLAARPFVSRTQLYGVVELAWWAAPPDQWESGLRGHPRIGGVHALRERFASTAAWSAGEQAAASVADEATLALLAERQDAYEARYGWPFVIDATGRSAADIAAAVSERLHRSPEAERAVSAAQVVRIALRRLEKWSADAARQVRTDPLPS